MALKGVGRVPMGLLPGPHVGQNTTYINLGATRRTHVLDKDRRMQSTPLGFVVPEPEAVPATANPHFTTIEEIL